MDRHPLQPPPGAISPLPTEDGSPILGSADHAIPVPRSPLPFPFHASTLSDDELFQHREYYKQLGAIASPDTRSPAQPSPPAVPPFPFDPSSWSDGMLAEALEQWSIPNAALHAGDSSEEGDVDDRSREGATATGGGAADETGELGDIDSTHGDSESMAETLSDRGDGTAPELVEEDRGIETGGQEGGPADPGAGGINVEGMEYQETGRILEESGAMEQSEAESDLTSLDDLSDLSDSRESSHMEGLGSPPSASTIAAALLLASLRKHLNSRSDSHDQEDGDEDDAIADAVRSSINSSFAIVKSPPPSHSQPSPPRIRNPRTGPWSHFHDPSQGSTFVLAGINCALYDEGPVGEPVGQECGRPRTDDAWRSLYAAFRKKTVAIHLFHYQRLVFDAFKVVCQKIPDAILDSLLLAHPFHIKSRSTLDTQALAYGLEDKLYQFVYAFGLEMEVETADEFLKSVEDEEGEFIDNATRKGMGASARAMVKGLKEEIERVKEEGGTIIRATSYVGWAAGFLSALNTHARFEDHLNTGEPHSLFTLILQQVRRNPTFVETSILRLSIVATLASLADFSSSTKMGAEQVVSVAIGSSSFEGGANVNSCGDASVLIAQLNYLSQQSPLDLIVDLPRSPISLCYIVQGKAEKWALEGADCKTVKEFLTEWWARVRSAKAKPSEDVELSEARRSAQERSRGQSAEEQRCKKMEEVLFRGSAYEGLAGGDEQVLSTPRVPGDCPWCASSSISHDYSMCENKYLSNRCRQRLADSLDLAIDKCIFPSCKTTGWQATSGNIDPGAPDARLEAYRPLLKHLRHSHPRTSDGLGRPGAVSCPFTECAYKLPPLSLAESRDRLFIHLEIVHRLPMRDQSMMARDLWCKVCRGRAESFLLPGTRDVHIITEHLASIQERLSVPSGYGYAEGIGFCPFCVGSLTMFSPGFQRRHVSAHLLDLPRESPDWLATTSLCPAPSCVGRLPFTPTQLVDHLACDHKIRVIKTKHLGGASIPVRWSGAPEELVKASRLGPSTVARS